MKQKILALIKAPTFVASVIGGLTTIGGVLVSYHFVSSDLESAVLQIGSVVFPASIALAAILLSGKKQQAAATLKHAQATDRLASSTAARNEIESARMGIEQQQLQMNAKAIPKVRPVARVAPKRPTTSKGQS